MSGDNVVATGKYNRFCLRVDRDRPIRSKPDNRINKNHMIEYFGPYDRINRKSNDQIFLPSISRKMLRIMLPLSISS